MRQQRTLGRFLSAAALVAAAAGAGVPAPAAAAGCSSAEGVTVVVDFNELGGGVPSVCDADGGGKKASTLFEDSGFDLSYASRQPGFVCRVSGVPTSDPCVNTAPANAYWGLWWSDGKTGSWSYSSLGAQSLTIPAGGYVAFSWDQSESSAAPSFTPAAHQSEPTPSQTPTRTPNPTTGPTTGPTTSPTAKPTPTPTHSTSTPAPPSGSSSASLPVDPTTAATSPSPSDSSASPSASASEGSPTPGAAPTDVPTDPAAEEQYVRPDAAEPESDGLPSFVAPALIGTVFGVAGIVFLVRRRSGST
ncbi:hypothetical protein NSZ01_10510 [Nocardioides szechwanensis]|uniref:Uncharacterized protein n=1 Tax=Nocardioides szechwanensis TaxID=1005944 RepID=A0A1G9UDV3_9ACTN|nr:hypothetical protein [Nocardioides szechwanensis]GEP33283.1 hypothetical protein NSZ01_10510 [Nocardioides szechwanensis]SDM58109.1 hypothetical protein SAMN05192576_0407 [Nocardioides szechwanensis]